MTSRLRARTAAVLRAAIVLVPSATRAGDDGAPTSLDDLATALPRKGDAVDGLRYLDNATGWSLSLLVVIPVVPVERS